MTTIRREVLTLPAARLGPDNPLPPLRPLDETHRIEDRDKAGLPRDMARQIGYAPLRSLLPVPVRDGYDRDREPRPVDVLVIENDRLRDTVLPTLGGRIASLVHLPTGRELLYRNPVFQPANFALNGAWFSGGIEWNIGATGHTTLSCSPVHAARVPAPDGGEMLRLWEWERLRDLPFQVDLWLPDGSDFLYVGVRIRNPHEKPVPTYWWSNIAVPEECRVLAPAEEAYQFGYERRLRRVPVPEYDGVDRTHPPHSTYAADYFYELPEDRRRWIAALDAGGHGLVQTSTDALRGRKLFVWGRGPGGRSWQRWLTDDERMPDAFWRGLRLMAVDGTVFDLPSGRHNEAAFDVPAGGSRPQARLVALAECGTLALAGAAFDSVTVGERTLFERLLDRLTPGMSLLRPEAVYSSV